MTDRRYAGLPIPTAVYVTAGGEDHVVIVDQDENILHVPQVWADYFGKTLNELVAGVNATMVRPLVTPSNIAS